MSSPTRRVGYALLCFVVLWGRFATDIMRAWLLKIQHLTIEKNPISTARRASNQVLFSIRELPECAVFGA